jgi:hypothetical protein
MFTISYDEARNFVRVTGTGTWNPIALAQFAIEARRIEVHHLVGRRDVRILGDTRMMTVQPDAVAQLCRGIVTRLLAKPGLRIALIVEAALLKLQLERTYAGLAVGIVASQAEAFAYLDIADCTPGAAA